MKSFFRLALLALVLLVVALVSAVTAMRFAIHGRETAVPDLVGKTLFEAARVAEQSGLQMEVEREYFSASVPEGRILSQVPASGAQVRRGWRIRVARSLGPQRVEIPNVVGQSQRAAEINIRRRGLDIAAVAEIPAEGSPTDQVVAQSPLANASGIASPKISLLVTGAQGAQALLMPNFVGQTLATATATLQNAGFRLGNVTMISAAPAAAAAIPAVSPTPPPVPEAASPSSVVASQNPPAGQKITLGSAIDFQVR